MLILKKKRYNPISCNFYPELKIIKISGIFGSNFIKLPNVFVLEKKKIFYFSKTKGSFSKFQKEFCLAVLGVSCGWFLTMELVGRGFSVSFQKNFLIFNVGLSHGFALFLKNNFQCQIEQKKKTKFLLFCNNYQELKDLSVFIKKIKPLNVYKGSGVKFENETIKLKIGKQSGN